MDHIYEANEQFDFNKLLAKKPISQSGGNFLIKFSMKDIPLYIQTPKCFIKQNIIKPNRKQLYCDLVFLQENESFIQWMENLENYSQQIIFKNKSQWFETDLELEDIENSFTSPMKSYKSGKSYIVRTNIPHNLGKSTLKIYDEDENMIQLEQLSENMQAITILEIQGIRCSSRSFQIEMEIKQMMVLKPVNLFERCILKPGTRSVIKDHSLGENVAVSSIVVKEEPFVSSNERIIKEGEPFESSNGPSIIEEGPFESSKQNIIVEEETEELISKPTEIADENIQIDTSETNILKEVDFDLEKIGEDETVTLRKRNEVYYEMYKEARRKAKVARDLALSSYLEAKRIKNTYMLDDIIDSDEDEEEEDEDEEEENDEE